MKTKTNISFFNLEILRLENILNRYFVNYSEYGHGAEELKYLRNHLKLIKTITFNSLLFFMVSCAPCKLATTPVKVIDYDKQTNIYIGQGKNCYCAFYSDISLSINDSIQAKVVEMGDITQNIPQRIIQ
jgi:hypothetical protein